MVNLYHHATIIDIVGEFSYFKTMPNDNYQTLKQHAIEEGADLFVVCETLKLDKYIDAELKDAAEKLLYTISIGVRLQKAVLDTIVDRPNQIYKTHYRQANTTLDHVIYSLARLIQSKGFKAIPIAASLIVDWEKQTSHLSHRHAALNAGLGFWGKNNLLIHPEFGAGIRLASLFTDMPLKVDSPIPNNCGDCLNCMIACPADAITENGFEFEKCYTQIKEFSRHNNYNLYICGLCVKACTDARRKT